VEVRVPLLILLSLVACGGTPRSQATADAAPDATHTVMDADRDVETLDVADASIERDADPCLGSDAFVDDCEGGVTSCDPLAPCPGSGECCVAGICVAVGQRRERGRRARS
jgi:hypothetical protein